jgi:hypothetical protein
VIELAWVSLGTERREIDMSPTTLRIAG